MNRPWVTPAQVISYTDIEAVQQRSTAKLAVDISRAEQYVISYCNNDFSAEEYSTSMPDSVLTAIMLLAEAYAVQAAMSAKQSSAVISTGLKSETFDDYSYTVADASSEVDTGNLDLSYLLDDYVLAEAKGKLVFRMRKL